MPLPRLNTSTKIGLSWFVAVAGGLYLFVLSKRHIDKTRYESMKVRERIRKANLAEYTPIRKFSD